MTARASLPLFAGHLLLAFATQLPAADWPEFRGPTGQGHSAETDLPTTWSETDNVTWKVAVPGLGWSSPIYRNGRLYLTSAVARDPQDPKKLSLEALCLDAESGKTLWNKAAFEQSPEEFDEIHRKNSHASATPISDGEYIYAHFGTHGTACFTLDGEIVWKNQELKYEPQHGNGGSPILVDDLLVVCCDGADINFVVALDRATGKIRWKTDRTVDPARKFSFSTPLLIEVDGQKQIVCPGTGAVTAYRPEDGSAIWKVDYAGGFSVVPRPVFAHGLVYVCTGFSVPKLMVIRPNGTGNITETHVAWTAKRAVPNTPSPLVIGDEVYMVSDSGIATCLDANTGRQHWQKRLSARFSASPVFADGKIYFQSEEGNSIVIQPGREFIELGRSTLKARTLASYAIADSAIFLRTDTSLYRIEKH